VAVCIENISAPGVQPVTWDLHAGRIDAGPLAKVATIFPVHPATEASQWGSGFTASGEHFLFSTPATGVAGAPEILSFIRTDQIGAAPATEVAVGASRWTLSASGARLFYLKDYNHDQRGAPSGTLHMREFPAGVSETRIVGERIPGGASGGVGAYQVLADQDGEDAGLGVLVDVRAGRGDYRWLKDPAASPDDPANLALVIDDISALPMFSPDLRYYVLPRALDQQAGTGGSWIVKADGTGACALTTSLTSGLSGQPFTSDSSLVFWMASYDPATDSGQGWVANPDGCTGIRQFSTGIDFWFVDGARGLLYSDDTNGVVSLRYAPIQQGQLAAGGLLQAEADRLYAILPGYTGVLYSLTRLGVDENMSGIYYLPLPPP
jgi:hypothetical protein